MELNLDEDIDLDLDLVARQNNNNNSNSNNNNNNINLLDDDDEMGQEEQQQEPGPPPIPVRKPLSEQTGVEKTLFYELCGIFERLGKVSKSGKKKEILIKMWQKFDRKVNLFPLMRLLLPQCDIQRQGYNVREKKVGQLYVKAIPLGPKTELAMKLTKYTNPKYAGQFVGDFGNVLFDVLKDRSITMGTKSIYDVNWDLDQLRLCKDQQVLFEVFLILFVLVFRFHYFFKILQYPCAKGC